MSQSWPLSLRLFPDPALRLVARPVLEFDQTLAQLADELAAAMSALGGVGLAAPQLGVSQRLILVRDGQVIQALVNPRLLDCAAETYLDREGCLSLPGLEVPVERSVAVTVAACSPAGEEMELELAGHGARVVQHEIDHLDGVLTIDRLRPQDRASVLPRLRELLRRGWPLRPDLGVSSL